MTEPNLTCQELVELVTEYLEGTLPESDRARFEAHASHCGGCAAYLEQMRTTVRLTGTLTGDTIEAISPNALNDLLETFRNWKKREG